MKSEEKQTLKATFGTSGACFAVGVSLTIVESVSMHYVVIPADKLINTILFVLSFIYALATGM